jgi:hypothetical protein
LQVFGVEAFGEPTVDLRQQLPGFGFLVPLLLQVPQAQYRLQLERLRSSSILRLSSKGPLSFK